MSDSIVIAHGGDLSHQSGGTNRVSAFASGLAANDHNVTLVAPEPNGVLPDRLEAVDTSFVSVPNSGVIDQPIRAAAIARRARTHANDSGVTVQFEHSTLGGVGQLFGEREYVLDMHDLAFASPLYGDLPLGSAVQRVIRGIEGRAVRSASAIVVVSENMKRLVREEWDVPAEKIRVIPNGYFADTVRPYRADEMVSGRVTFLGTLHPKLDATAIYEISALPEVEEMVVIGSGAKEEELREGKEERGLEALRIEGHLPDEEAFRLLSRSAVAINPQHRSSLQRASSPVKIYYYTALGLPMVLSAGPSVAAKLDEEGAAETVQSEESFVTAVQNVLSDEEQRSEMQATAERLSDEFSWSHRVTSLSEVYESV